MAHFFTFAKTALKNLISKPVTTKYPDAPIDYPVRSRGHIEIDIDQCISCSLCVRNCPTECLAVDKNAGTWTINRFDCIVCGYCTVNCPKHCLKVVNGYQKPGTEKQAATYQKSPEVMAAEKAKKEALAKKKAEALKKAQAAKAAKAAQAAEAKKEGD